MIRSKMMKKIFITIKELAVRWGMSPITLRQWKCQKKGPEAFKIGGRISYKLEDIEAFEESRRCKRKDNNKYRNKKKR